MSIAEYFQNAKGQGILATADKDGNVDAAVYAKPKILEENTIAFIMRDSLTHANVNSNLHACYLFVENEGDGYRGLRLYLRRLYEEEDSERLHILRKADHNWIQETGELRGPLFLVVFRIDKIRAMIPQGVNPLEEERAAA